jgi:uncharacterized protein YbjT (DUF2867 family)
MDPTDVETVFVAGASGGTGRQLLRTLGPRVPTVRALTRSPGKRSTLRRAGADEVVVDDVLDPTDLEGAVAGADAVLSALGSSVTDVRGSGPLVDGAGTVALLEAAVAADVPAFVMLSAIGVGDDPASPLATAFDVAIGPVQRAKAEAEAAIRSAPVGHAIFRPGVLTNGPRTDDVAVARPGAKLWGAVSRADVARLMAAAPVTDAAADETFEVVSTPRFSDRRLSVDWRLPGSADRGAVEVDVVDRR